MKPVTPSLLDRAPQEIIADAKTSLVPPNGRNAPASNVQEEEEDEAKDVIPDEPWSSEQRGLDIADDVRPDIPDEPWSSEQRSGDDFSPAQSEIPDEPWASEQRGVDGTGAERKSTPRGEVGGDEKQEQEQKENEEEQEEVDEVGLFYIAKL
ncbi:hypothetical protein M427DRAFT_219924 [Gonapodya prolifera JEL478]|uniref:Uncharacterized protein n=1 Tax=Gonapodya prolifera (strain JEL478) TaxID=1344416 RepID=A0A138ZYI7_GONPJ|nr:hypothetical protein M427DRAFT_219924 [Gonapodya prolifera JEL478]|eukprot:KXS09566.1 hypothetical protein M427DRAFT_219924 [Gonapodya prolifera JEL478]